MHDVFHLGVKALVSNESGKILLLRTSITNHKKTSNWNGQTYWNLPGGRMARGESITDSLLRELKEETGMDEVLIGEQFYSVVSNFRIPVNDSDVGLLLMIYKCTTKGTAVITLSPEHDDYRWVPVNEVKELLSYKYPRECLDKIL